MPARLTPSSWLSRWISRSSSTSRALYRRPPPAARPGCTSPSRSYWRSVCGCMPASRAATEITSTLASEACSIEMKYSSTMAHLPIDVLARRGRGRRCVLLQRGTGALRKVLGNVHVDGHQEIAVAALALGHALAAYPQDAAARGTGWHPHGHRAVQRRYGQVDAVDRLRERDRHRQREVVAVPTVELVAPYLDQHEEVASRPAPGARFTPAGEPDLLPVGHPGRDAYVERAGLGDPAGTEALRALDVDDGADALALPARLGEAERALVVRGQPDALADRAGPGDRPGLGAAAVAGVADSGGAQGQRQRRAVDRVPEVEQDLGPDVPAPRRAAPGGGGAAPPAGPGDRAEQVGEPGTTEPPVAARMLGRGVAEDVGHVEGRAGTAPGTPAERAGAEEAAHLVVLFALLVVGEYVVGLGDRFEPVLGVGVAGIVVGVQLARELPVRLLDLVGRRGLADAEHGVEVLLQPVLRAHPYSGSATATSAGRSRRLPSR